MLAWRLLWRNWRSGELKILAAALVVAVAVVTAIAVVTNRMEQSLERQSNTYLAADRVVTSRFPVPDAWLDKPAAHQLQQARVTTFNSMVFADEEMHLASVKAVSDNYPLRGQLEVSQQAFAMGDDIDIAEGVPPLGEAWVDSRLLPLLNIALGDQLIVGDKTFTVSNVVIREPDQVSGFGIFGPRVLINDVDLAATGVIQPGSRVNYRWLLAGEEANIKQFEQWLQTQLGDHYEMLTVSDAQQNIRQALQRSSNFLMLASMIGVILASVAIAIAAQQFASHHVDQVALMKSLGVGVWQVRRLYISQLLYLAMLASFIGLLVGETLQQFIALSIASLFKVELIAAAPLSYAIGILTGLVCLLLFALPPLWHLPRVPPLKVLRRELIVNQLQLWVRSLLGVLAVIVLIWVFSESLVLTLAVVSGLAMIIIVAGLAALLMLRFGRQVGVRTGNLWRLALSGLERHLAQSVTQIIVFGSAIMLLVVLFSVRSVLIEDWRLQLPDDTPNHFILNIAVHEYEEIKDFFQDRQFKVERFYPMVMGRLMAMNGQIFSENLRDKEDALQRELNLSWSHELPDVNKILEGQWWDDWNNPGSLPGVSVEKEVAEQLGISVGDELSFSLTGFELTAQVASVRFVDWNSMRPNFYFLFSPGALDLYSPNYLTSVYIPASQKPLINELLQNYPTIVVIEADRIISRVRAIVTQISRVVELVLWLVLAGGVLVLIAAANASMEARMQESGLLRALGSGRKQLLGSIWLEFSLLGLLAGILAVAGGETLLMSIQVELFEQSPSPHYLLWWLVPLLSAAVIGILGISACRKVVTVPPGEVLRGLDN